jgi:uncharacterized protein YdaU (DUF1376 family)
MSRPVWMPFYVGDYLRDTRRLSTVEHGAYLLLIMEYWTQGGLPDDDKKLARIAGLSLDEWTDIRDNIADLFQPAWQHKRIDAELAKAAARSDSAKEKANRRWQSQGNPPDNADAMPQHMPQQSQSTCTEDASHSHSHSHIEKKERNARDARSSFDKEFSESFWPAYPNKVGKPAAERAYQAARKRGADLARIMAGLTRYMRDKPVDRPWLNPATFLNQERWADEPASAAVLPFTSGADPPRVVMTEAEKRAAAIKFDEDYRAGKFG